jgi:hypothetical protein
VDTKLKLTVRITLRHYTSQFKLAWVDATFAHCEFQLLCCDVAVLILIEKVEGIAKF